MPISQDILDQLTQATSDFTTALTALEKMSVVYADEADNTRLVNGETAAMMQLIPQYQFGLHVADHNNPHQDTLENIGNLYSRDEINAKLATLIASKNFPLTMYGGFGGAAIGVEGHAGDASPTVYFTSMTPLYSGGITYQMPIQSFDLGALFSGISGFDPNNATFYAYVVVTNGVPAYVFTQPILDASHVPAGGFYIGSVTTASGAISAIAIEPGVFVGPYKISTVAAGGAIPVSGGEPMSTSHLNWK